MRTGPALGALAALAVLAMTTALLRTPTGQGGVAAITTSDGTPASAAFALVTAAWLAAGAFGTWLAVPRREDREPSAAPTAAATVGAVLAALAPIVLVLSSTTTSPGRLALSITALELAVAAGVGAGLLLGRHTAGTGMVAAATATLVLALAIRCALVETLVPGPLIDPAGRLTADAAAALRALEDRLPVGTGVAALLGAALGGAVTRARPAAALLVGLAPPALWAAGTVIGLVGAGTPVFTSVQPGEWICLAVGGPLGAGSGYALGRAIRRRSGPGGA
ncbi:hypothetical protein DPM19_05830 [Actinomadura craniellae]|uniref:Uncharacterized protein n=1 Tax=Actinomadura craniellae TaxID=2231787 RepID=A0A365HB67_9ACTN|nr:hypothetical protein [Actinomadura craniellae]RAY16394.1 hypothetical protein DPM19_05830 [Actinomadura craniellae]